MPQKLGGRWINASMVTVTQNPRVLARFGSFWIRAREVGSGGSGGKQLPHPQGDAECHQGTESPSENLAAYGVAALQFRMLIAIYEG